MWQTFISGIVSGIIATLIVEITLKKWLGKLIASKNENTIELYGKVKAFKTREKVTEMLVKIEGNTRTGDTLFGHCRTCRGYSEEFFEELEELKKRGVNVMVILALSNESRDFARRILEIGRGSEEYNAKWEIRGIESEEIRIRVFGYKSQDGERGEILIAFPFVNAYIGLYFKDVRVVEYIWPSFKEKWDDEKINILSLENNKLITDKL